jgi:hypothetical protein
LLFAQAAAEATAISTDNARAAPVAISGATGASAAVINGVYEPTEEKGLDGRALYRKRGDPSMCMEHRDGQWEVKPVSSKGTAAAYAYVAGGCAAEACTSRMWKVWDGATFQDAPSLNVVAESEVSSCCVKSLAFLTDLFLPPPTPSPAAFSTDNAWIQSVGCWWIYSLGCCC